MCFLLQQRGLPQAPALLEEVLNFLMNSLRLAGNKLTTYGELGVQLYFIFIFIKTFTFTSVAVTGVKKARAVGAAATPYSGAREYFTFMRKSA